MRGPAPPGAALLWSTTNTTASWRQVVSVRSAGTNGCAVEGFVWLHTRRLHGGALGGSRSCPSSPALTPLVRTGPSMARGSRVREMRTTAEAPVPS
jgi:hypothetical protein